VDDSTSVDSINKKIVSLEIEHKKATQGLGRLLTKKQLVNAYASTSMGMGKEASATTPFLSLPSALEILSFHSAELARLDDEELELGQRQHGLSTEIQELKRKLRNVTDACSSAEASWAYVVTATLSVTEVEVSFELAYVVSNASWSASYDIRVGGADRTTMVLTYFAEVVQKSGEDWDGCKLLLSTSNPAIGASPPDLHPKKVTLARAWDHQPKGGRPGGAGDGYHRSRSPAEESLGGHGGGHFRQSSFALSDRFDQLGGGGGGPLSPPPPSSPGAEAIGAGDAGSTVFAIARPVSIAGDNKGHKVTIALLGSLKPELVHYCVPSMSAHVYIQAKTRNASPYPFLPSAKVSVYLDGNFISTSALPQTGAGESFLLFLGVDPALKVEYLPQRTQNMTKGFVFGQQDVRKTFHTTVLHNTKDMVVRCLVVEQLPISEDEKIVVELLEPAAAALSAKSDAAGTSATASDVAAGFLGDDHDGGSAGTAPAWPKDFVALNKKTNNLVWLRTLAPKEKTEISFVYRIAWPAGGPPIIVSMVPSAAFESTSSKGSANTAFIEFQRNPVVLHNFGPVGNQPF
jgi:hypothetical protein